VHRPARLAFSSEIAAQTSGPIASAIDGWCLLHHPR
jgi:hypothetical protein